MPSKRRLSTIVTITWMAASTTLAFGLVWDAQSRIAAYRRQRGPEAAASTSAIVSGGAGAVVTCTSGQGLCLWNVEFGALEATCDGRVSVSPPKSRRRKKNPKGTQLPYLRRLIFVMTAAANTEAR
jgi:hypothetical protein